MPSARRPEGRPQIFPRAVADTAKATLDSSAPARGAAEHHIGFTVIDGCISTWRRHHQTQLTMLDKKDGSGLRFAMIFARSLAPVINCMTQATMPTLNERAFVLEH